MDGIFHSCVDGIFHRCWVAFSSFVGWHFSYMMDGIFIHVGWHLSDMLDFFFAFPNMLDVIHILVFMLDFSYMCGWHFHHYFFLM